MLVSMIAALMLQAAAAQAPSEQAAGASAPNPPAQSGQNRTRGGTLVCRERPPTGSVLRRNVCRTERRTAAERRAVGEYLRDVTPNVPVDPSMTP